MELFLGQNILSVIYFNVQKSAWPLYKFPNNHSFYLAFIISCSINYTVIWRIYDCRWCCIEGGFSLVIWLAGLLRLAGWGGLGRKVPGM